MSGSWVNVWPLYAAALFAVATPIVAIEAIAALVQRASRPQDPADAE